MFRIRRDDVFGLLHPSIDVHTLGMLSFSQLLEDCGIRTRIADGDVCDDVESLARNGTARNLGSWLRHRGITVLGFSYRLDPGDAVRLFSVLHAFLVKEGFLGDGGRLRGIFFAGLPDACREIAARFPQIAAVFSGDESPHDITRLLGISEDLLPDSLAQGLSYDENRMKFAARLLAEETWKSVKPVDRSGSRNFGRRGDRVVARLAHGSQKGLPPLIRAHAGPYLPDRKEAVSLFLDWTKALASSGYLDILSIGTSQLSQSDLGGNWEGKVNGGGVPIASAAEFAEVWKAARPMLVRTYAGTKDVPALAKMYEDTIDIAWHALSLWWFCRLDGRGPNSVMQNLEEHFAAMRWIASTGKPFEPNVPHHFAFRGTDDLGYVVSGYVAARAARAQGIRHLILQVMLNTPKYLWGIQDLARAKVLVRLVRSLEGPDFRVHLQPRGGLDYFSPDPDKAKRQLAAVTAMMDDIEPEDETSPQIIHVVSYSEGYGLADPPVIDESIRITRAALSEYRRLKKEGAMEDMRESEELGIRMESLYRDAKAMIAALERHVPDPWSPSGLYSMLKAGVFAVPWLTSCKEEFPAADIPVKLVRGSMCAVDEKGLPLSVEARIDMMKAALGAGRGGFHGS
jgi:hypothetical protein